MVTSPFRAAQASVPKVVRRPDRYASDLTRTLPTAASPRPSAEFWSIEDDAVVIDTGCELTRDVLVEPDAIQVLMHAGCAAAPCRLLRIE